MRSTLPCGVSTPSYATEPTTTKDIVPIVNQVSGASRQVPGFRVFERARFGLNSRPECPATGAYVQSRDAAVDWSHAPDLLGGHGTGRSIRSAARTRYCYVRRKLARRELAG